MKTLALAAALLLLPGCVLVAGAAVGAGIVYAAGEDTCEVRVDVDGDAAFAASRAEVVRRGSVDSTDEALGVIEARIGDSSVRVTVVEEGGGGHSLVRVKARTLVGLAPDRGTAEAVAVAVVRRTR